MDINSAIRVMLRTHVAALSLGSRANAMMLESPPGIGKSDGCMKYAADLARTLNERVGIVPFMLATISSVDVRGFMLPQKGTVPGTMDTVFSTPPWFPTRWNAYVVDPDGTWSKPGTWEGDMPRVGVLFLDEFGQAEDEVKKPAAELLLKGGVGTFHLPDNWRVIAAGNRLTDRSGVMRELMFIVNRRCRLTVDPNLPAWLDWVDSQPAAFRPHYMTVSFARQNPNIVFADKVPDGSDPFCSPRTLCLLDRDLQALRSDEDIANGCLPTDRDAREVAAGWIGSGSAAQFFTHLKYSDEMPEMKDIEADPRRARLPEHKDAQMVTGYMLAQNLTSTNADSVLAYVDRLQSEMQVMTMRAITQRPDTSLHMVNTVGFTKWLARHKNLLIASNS